MKRTLLLALSIAAITMVACKKENSADPVTQKTVVKSEGSLESFNKNANNDKSMTWYSAEEGKAYSMETVKANLALSSKIDFGMNVNDVEFGLYSTTSYPQAYGQQTWPTQNATTFKETAGDQKVYVKLFDETPEKITPEFIDQTFSEGFAPSSQITATNISDLLNHIFVFQTAGGKRGLIRFLAFDENAKTCSVDVRFAK